MNLFKTWTFEWWEISLIKLCLISLGILLGIYFYDYLASFVSLWWAIFAVTGIYFIGRFFKDA